VPWSRKAGGPEPGDRYSSCLRAHRTRRWPPQVTFEFLRDTRWWAAQSRPCGSRRPGPDSLRSQPAAGRFAPADTRSWGAARRQNHVWERTSFRVNGPDNRHPAAAPSPCPAPCQADNLWHMRVSPSRSSSRPPRRRPPGAQAPPPAPQPTFETQVSRDRRRGRRGQEGPGRPRLTRDDFVVSENGLSKQASQLPSRSWCRGPEPRRRATCGARRLHQRRPRTAVAAAISAVVFDDIQPHRRPGTAGAGAVPPFPPDRGGEGDVVTLGRPRGGPPPPVDPPANCPGGTGLLMHPEAARRPYTPRPLFPTASPSFERMRIEEYRGAEAMAWQ